MADDPAAPTPEAPLPTPPPEPVQGRDPSWKVVDEANSWVCPDCGAKANVERPWGVSVSGPGLPIERRCAQCDRWLGHEPPA